MLKDNLIMLRNIHGFSQEEIAEKINISRQAYAKWENGSTVPDIQKCCLLASIYGVTIDSLVNTDRDKETGYPQVAPIGKNIWGSITMNDRGQVVIPKEARDLFNLTAGTRLIVLSDENGIALITAQKFEENMREILKLTKLKPIDLDN